ncbi:MAG: 50S ribosomal protein L35 [Myxococcales bacterium]|nr:50S ribosomal protein L35 [Myxococcales bacterium]MCB9544777.1 50S ribosomal protein L35 [Myxococcales bacterium]
MPKMKTNKGAAKRFRVSKDGKVRFGRANKRHILTKMSAKRKRQLRSTGTLCASDVKLVKRMLPYA